MGALYWVPPGATALLDVGCNVGEFLVGARATYPALRLAGCDVNPTAVEHARRAVPGADVQVSEADALPYPDGAFDCLTCIEVLEHVPPARWSAALREMRRVLRPGGRLVLRTPHAGLFAWLDTNNIRFRFPWLYRRLIGRGRRDEGFRGRAEAVEWHHHFTRRELIELAGDGWRVETTRYGGLVLAPLGDYLRWPFYRLGRGGHPVERFITRVMATDSRIDYGPLSYSILVVLAKA
jgi:SAM-dependent methyltransferase